MPEAIAEKPAQTEKHQATHLVAYTVKEIGSGDAKRSIFTRVGAAFPHKDGLGFNLELDAIPFERKLVVLPPRDKEA